MALNRLIDAEIDARNPRTAGAELPSRALRRGQVLRSASSRSRSSSSRSGSSTRSSAGSGRSRCRLRRLPVPEALHVALRTSGSGRSTGSRRSAPGSRSPASCRGRPGRSAAQSRFWIAGFDLFYALFDVDVDRRRACTRGRRGSAYAACSPVRARSMSLTVALLVAAGLGLDVGVVLLARRRGGRGAAAVRALLVRPDDLRRLDAAFFTVNGVISIVFFVFVAARRPLVERRTARAAVGVATKDAPPRGRAARRASRDRVVEGGGQGGRRRPERLRQAELQRRPRRRACRSRRRSGAVARRAPDRDAPRRRRRGGTAGFDGTASVRLHRPARRRPGSGVGPARLAPAAPLRRLASSRRRPAARAMQDERRGDAPPGRPLQRAGRGPLRPLRHRHVARGADVRGPRPGGARSRWNVEPRGGTAYGGRKLARVSASAATPRSALPRGAPRSAPRVVAHHRLEVAALDAVSVRLDARGRAAARLVADRGAAGAAMPRVVEHAPAALIALERARIHATYTGRVISARSLEKRYGSKRVIAGLDLDVPRGGFVLVTGPNGSGKTTLLRLVAGLAAPSGGSSRSPSTAGRIGFLAHEPLVYRELTALENLELFGRLYRVPERRERIGMLLERFGLWDVRAERVGIVLAWDAAAARALPRRCSTSPSCCCSTSRTTHSTPTGPRCSTASSRSCAASADVPRRHARSGAARGARDAARVAFA